MYLFSWVSWSKVRLIESSFLHKTRRHKNKPLQKHVMMKQLLLIFLDVTKNVPRVFMEEAVNTNADVKTELGKL